MLFRRLRLKTKIAANKRDELKNDGFVGFYLPCESLFFHRFSDLNDTLVERHRDALIVFFEHGGDHGNRICLGDPARSCCADNTSRAGSNSRLNQTKKLANLRTV